MATYKYVFKNIYINLEPGNIIPSIKKPIVSARQAPIIMYTILKSILFSILFLFANSWLLISNIASSTKPIMLQYTIVSICIICPPHNLCICHIIPYIPYCWQATYLLPPDIHMLTQQQEQPC